ncbi:hypothetical protein [Arthrobacter humicola]
MNDQNIPPIPPPYPVQPPQTNGQGTPAYGQPPNQQDYPGQYPQGYPAQQSYGQRYAGKQGYGQAPAYQQPYLGQPAFGNAPYPLPGYQRPGPTLAKSSGYRLASGIVGICMGVWLFFSFLIGVSLGQSAILILTLIGCFGSIASGIVLLVKQRDRGRGAPITMISVAAAALLLSFASFGQFVFTFMFALPIFIVMGIGLAREGRAQLN